MTSYRSTHAPILYLSRADVQAACAGIDAVETMRELFLLHASGETVLPAEAYLGWENGEGCRVRSLGMPGFVGGRFRSAGTKVINANPRNPDRGVERASGLTLLFDDLTARVRCVMDAGHVSSLRTAAVSTLAVELLRAPGMDCVAVVGAGVLGRAHLELMLARFPALQRALVFDLDGTRAERLRHEMAARFGHVRVERAASAEEAVRAAQVVVPATTTTTGYIPFEWLRPGCVVVNVSLDDLLPDVITRADLLLVDDWELVRADPRRLLGRMYRQGTLVGPREPDPPHPCRRVDGELGDLVARRTGGRRGPGDVVVVNPFGLAIEDVALATLVYRRALETGLGQELAP